jgi:phospholipid/cholesterol/gamma-HCH transport system substrate-binding protein
MDLRYGREVIVGTLVLVAIAVFIFGTMWLSGRSVSPGDMLTIQFADVSGLKRASPVRVSGLAVGKVEQIDFEDVGKVRVSVSLPEHIVPRTDARAEIKSISLVGDYAVDLDPGKGPPLPKGQVIIGTRAAELAGMATGLAGRADSVLAGLQSLTSPEMVRRLEVTMTGLQATLAAAQQTMALYGNASRGPTAELTRTMAQFRELSQQLSATLASPALQRSIGSSDTLTANFSKMAQALASTGNRLDTLLARMNAGQGTLGKFATDSALYYSILRATTQLDSVMAAIKKDPGKIPITVRIF